MLMFWFQTTMTDGGNLLVLEVCRINKTDKNIFLELTFPSGYAFIEFYHKPYNLKYKFSNLRLENIYLSNGNSHLFHVPDSLFLSFGDCWNALAYRNAKVYFDKPMSDKRSFGWVTIYSATDYKKKTINYFFI